MAKLDIITKWAGFNFTALSTPRRIKLVPSSKNVNYSTGGLEPGYNYLKVYNPSGQHLYIATNGLTAASTASTALYLPTLLGGDASTQARFRVPPSSVQWWYTKATSLSFQLSGATSASIGVMLGQY